MSNNKQNGINWSLDGETIDVFGARGMKLSSSSWAVNVLGGAFVEVDPSSMMDQIRDCIAHDVAQGNGDKIAQVQLGARQAVIFFLEGKLTREHFTKATEAPDFIYIREVAVDDRTLTVLIAARPLHSVATADSDGNVL